MRNSFMVAAIHALLVAVVWINYAWAQRTQPRAWTPTAPVDPYDFMRGRYVVLGLSARPSGDPTRGMGKLFVKDGQLYIEPADCCTRFVAQSALGDGYVRLVEPTGFFIPQDIPDPSILKAGEKLWVEVSVPPNGKPRPIRLAVKSQDGSWRELPAINN